MESKFDIEKKFKLSSEINQDMQEVLEKDKHIFFGNESLYIRCAIIRMNKYRKGIIGMELEKEKTDLIETHTVKDKKNIV